MCNCDSGEPEKGMRSFQVKVTARQKIRSMEGHCVWENGVSSEPGQWQVAEDDLGHEDTQVGRRGHE
jgi:hypothetical protein